MNHTEQFNRIMLRTDSAHNSKKRQASTQSVKIEPRANMNDLQASIAKCTLQGNTVHLPTEILTNYQDVRKALLNAGAQYKKNSFVFPNDAKPYIDRLMDGQSVNIKKEFQAFFTPPQLAKRVAELADLNHENLKCLEPSAGQGALILAGLEIQAQLCFDAYELMDVNRGVLQGIDNVTILGNDFLEANGSKPVYDRILANPPFSKNQDIIHTLKMWELLKPGGRMVVINSKHWQTSLKKKEREYKEWLESVGAVIELVDGGEFKSSGTMIETVLITIDKPL